MGTIFSSSFPASLERSLQCVVLAHARNGTALCFLLHARNVFALAKSNFKNPVELFHTHLLATDFSESSKMGIHGREGGILEVISEMCLLSCFIFCPFTGY